ncbi:MAG TPA: type II secretion system F family protein [Candidatus Nanoarchaeia archaeon]|nr:type II secretion system F family protein [Candidatus Nanoarchaeia archaeon]
MIKPSYIISSIIGLLLAGLDYYYLFSTRYFTIGIVISIIIAIIWPLLDYVQELKRQREQENIFLEFSRNLVEAIKSGIPLPKAILNVSKKDYRSLNKLIKKLASQVELGIPVRTALWTFANTTNNTVIKRSINIMNEAERSGGDIKDVLDNIVESVLQIKKLKEERKTGIYGQIMQGYFVYILFIAIMLVLQLWLFPKLTSIAGTVGTGIVGTTISGATLQNPTSLDNTFFALLMIQGFFAGIMIGKLSEGTLKQGLLHSFILMTLAAVIITTIKGGI